MLLRPLLRPVLRPLLRTPLEVALGFSPLSLFANGEQGAFYAPWDLSTLFQDSAGTTPVTAVGQPVGLILDKRLGAVRGAEGVVNGTFATNSDWTGQNNGVVSISGGVLTCTNSGVFFGRAANTGASFAVAVGEFYECRVTIPADSGNLVYARLATSGGTALSGLSPAMSPGSTNTFFLQATTAGTGLLRFENQASTDGGSFKVSFASCKKVPGNHATQATAASRPTLQRDASGYYYLSFDGVDDSLATGSIDFSSTDKMTVWAGVTAGAGATQMIAELSATNDTNNGSFNLFCNGSNQAQWALKGDAGPSRYLASAPLLGGNSRVISCAYDIAGAAIADEMQPRINATAPTLGVDLAGPAGAGNFGNYPLYIGRRGGSSLPFNGRLYSLIVRGASTDAATLSRAERFVGSRMGISL